MVPPGWYNAAAIARDSAMAQTIRDKWSCQTLDMHCAGVVLGLEPSDTSDYYLFLLCCGSDTTVYGKILVNCKTGHVLHISNHRGAIQPSTGHEHDTCYTEQWVRSNLSKGRGVELERWWLVMTTINTQGECINYLNDGTAQTSRLNSPHLWIPPVLMARAAGKYYFVAWAGRVFDLKDLNPKVLERLEKTSSRPF